jgi:hypothetical protein
MLTERYPSVSDRLAMNSTNRLKLGIFGSNLSSGKNATTLPERWHATWDENIRHVQPLLSGEAKQLMITDGSGSATLENLDANKYSSAVEQREFDKTLRAEVVNDAGGRLDLE